MSTMASQITSDSIVYSTVCSGTDQGKHQSSASLAFVGGIHRWLANSPHKGPVTRKMFPFDDVIIKTSPCPGLGSRHVQLPKVLFKSLLVRNTLRHRTLFINECWPFDSKLVKRILFLENQRTAQNFANVKATVFTCENLRHNCFPRAKLRAIWFSQNFNYKPINRLRNTCLNQMLSTHNVMI